MFRFILLMNTCALDIVRRIQITDFVFVRKPERHESNSKFKILFSYTIFIGIGPYPYRPPLALVITFFKQKKVHE